MIQRALGVALLLFVSVPGAGCRDTPAVEVADSPAVSRDEIVQSRSSPQVDRQQYVFKRPQLLALPWTGLRACDRYILLCRAIEFRIYPCRNADLHVSADEIKNIRLSNLSRLAARGGRESLKRDEADRAKFGLSSCLGMLETLGKQEHGPKILEPEWLRVQVAGCLDQCLRAIVPGSEGCVPDAMVGESREACDVALETLQRAGKKEQAKVCADECESLRSDFLDRGLPQETDGGGIQPDSEYQGFRQPSVQERMRKEVQERLGRVPSLPVGDRNEAERLNRRGLEIGRGTASLQELRIEAYKKALRADATAEWPRYNLACELAVLGRREEAIDQLIVLKRLATSAALEALSHARADADFIALRDDLLFRAVVGEE